MLGWFCVKLGESTADHPRNTSGLSAGQIGGSTSFWDGFGTNFGTTADCPGLKTVPSIGDFGWETQITISLVDLEFCTVDRPRQRAGLSASHEKCPKTAQLRVDIIKV